MATLHDETDQRIPPDLEVGEVDLTRQEGIIDLLGVKVLQVLSKESIDQASNHLLGQPFHCEGLVVCHNICMERDHHQRSCLMKLRATLNSPPLIIYDLETSEC